MPGRGSWVSRWYRRLGIVVAVFLGVSWGLGPAQQASAETLTLTGRTSGWTADHYLISDLNTTSGNNVIVRAEYTIEMQPGFDGWARWECEGYSYVAVRFTWAASQPGNYTLTVNKSNVPVSEMMVGASCGTHTAYHVWSTAGSTGFFRITAARVIYFYDPTGPAPSTGVPTLEPVTPGPTWSPDAMWTYCPEPVPSGFIGPPAPSLCPVVDPTPTPTPPSVCDGHWWCYAGAVGPAGAGRFPIPVAGPSLVSGTAYEYEFHGVANAQAGTFTWEAYAYGTGAGCVDSCANPGIPDGPFRDANWWIGPNQVQTFAGSWTQAANRTGAFTIYVNLGATSSNHAMTAASYWWIDPVGWDATPGPTGTPAPTLPPAPTSTPLPPAGGAPGAPSPVIVELCAEDDSIAACATPQVLPSFALEGPDSTWFADRIGALASGLNEKAPFGYVSQVGAAITEATDPEYIGGAGGCEDWSFDLPVWAPPGAAIPNQSASIPCDSFTALSVIRPLALAFVVVAFGFLMLRTIIGALGGGKGSE